MKKLLVALVVGCLWLQTQAAESVWLTDLPKAQAQAKAENKLVLLDFTGSDWCIWCIKLDTDTFSKPEFQITPRKTSCWCNWIIRTKSRNPTI